MKKTTLDSQFYELVGNRLTKARKNKKLTLKEVSKILNKSPQMLDYIELGKSRIDEIEFNKLCKLYDLQGKINIEIDLE